MLYFSTDASLQPQETEARGLFDFPDKTKPYLVTSGTRTVRPPRR